MALDPFTISAGISLVSGLFDRGKQKKIDAKNAKAAAQADYENKMQHANVNRMNKKATERANIRNQKASTRINNRNVKLVRETNKANADAQLAADVRSEASAAAARKHDIEAAELNRSQGLDDIKYSAVRLREAASLGGFNPLTFLEATGGVGPVAGSGVGGRALQYSASAAIAPQVTMGPASQAYLRNAYASQAIQAAPLRSTAGIAGALQDLVMAPGQAAQAARDQATQTLKDDVLKIEAERLKYNMSQPQTGPYRSAGAPRVASSGALPMPKDESLYIRYYDYKEKRWIEQINPDAMEAGPMEMLTGGALLAAGDFAQNVVPAAQQWLKDKFTGDSSKPPATPFRTRKIAPVARPVPPKISVGKPSQSGKAGRYAR